LYEAKGDQIIESEEGKKEEEIDEED